MGGEEDRASKVMDAPYGLGLDRRLISRSTASRMKERASSFSPNAARTRSIVPAAKLTRNFSGHSSRRPTRLGVSHIGFSTKPDIFRISVIDDERYISHIRYQSNGDTQMARFAYFADLSNGQTLEWHDTVERGEVRAARGISNNGRGDIKGYAEGLGWVAVTRSVQMKSSPSRHDCDDRCMYAEGRTMKCECSCGGRNHGKGRFVCEEAA